MKPVSHNRDLSSTFDSLTQQKHTWHKLQVFTVPFICVWTFQQRPAYSRHTLHQGTAEDRPRRPPHRHQSFGERYTYNTITHWPQVLDTCKNTGVDSQKPTLRHHQASFPVKNPFRKLFQKRFFLVIGLILGPWLGFVLHFEDYLKSDWLVGVCFTCVLLSCMSLRPPEPQHE